MDNSKISIGDSLRELAAWYDQHPEIKAPYMLIGIYENGPSAVRELAAVAKAFGTCKKEINDYDFSISRTFGRLTLTASASRSSICRKVVTYDCPESLLASLGMTAEEVAASI